MTADEVLLKKPEDKPKKKSYLQGENLPLEQESRNPLTRIWNWYKNAKVKPYATIKDLNNPEGDNDGRPSKSAAEIGIKISF